MAPSNESPPDLHFDRHEGFNRIKTVNVPPLPEEIVKGLEPYERSALSFQIAAFELLGDDALQAGNSPRLYYSHRPPTEQMAQIYSVKDAADAQPERVTFFEVEGGRTIQEWTPVLGDNLRGKYRKGGVIFGMDLDGSEVFQLWRYWEDAAQDTAVDFEVTSAELDNQPGRGRIERLTNDNFKYHNPLVSQEGRGDYLAFGSNRENNKDTKVYIVNLSKPNWTPTLVFDNPKGLSTPSSFSADERFLICSRVISSNNIPRYVVDLQNPDSPPKRLLLPGINENDEVAIRSTYFSKRLGSLEILITLDGYGDFNSFVIYDLQTNVVRHITTPNPAFSALHPLPWNVSLSAVTENSALLVANVDGYTETFYYNVATGAFKKLTLPGYEHDLVTDIEVQDASRVAVRLTSSHQAGSIFYADISDLNAITVTPYVSCQTGRPPYPTQEPALIRYKSFDGLSIPAWVYMPSVSDVSHKVPVVVYIHGGPVSQVRPSFQLSLHGYLVNELGVAMICPNVRGSSGYGKAYEKADDVYKREDSVRDIGALLEYICSSMPEIDPSRIAIMGGSYGGYMTFACLVHYSPLVRCGVASCGIASWPTFLQATHPSRAAHRREEYGDETDPKVRAFLEEISPINHVDKINVPLYISQGEKDTRVPLGEALMMFEKVSSKGLDTWLVVGEMEGHGFKQKDCIEFVNASKALFLRKWLLNDADVNSNL